jgi:hypothetical protein
MQSDMYAERYAPPLSMCEKRDEYYRRAEEGGSPDEVISEVM